MGSHDKYDPADEQVFRTAGQVPPWQRVYLDGEDVTATPELWPWPWNPDAPRSLKKRSTKKQ